MGNSVKTIRLFYSYAHQDERFRKNLEQQLAILKRLGVISAWHDRIISPGSEWKQEIKRELDRADIILLLVSPAFMASEFCYDMEMKRALERHSAGEARVIPVILRPCQWKDARFADLQALPKSGKPIATWSNRDEAFLDVADGIKTVAAELTESYRHDRGSSCSGLSEGESMLPHIDPFRVPIGDVILYRRHAQKRPVRCALDLLDPLTRAIPLVGREVELDSLNVWLTAPGQILVRCVTGQAGSGKTRLALELCSRAEEQGWLAGFVELCGLLRFLDCKDRRSWRWPCPTLIIIDGTAAAAASLGLRRWLLELAKPRAVAEPPLRLLLLERHASVAVGWWPNLMAPTTFDEERLTNLFDTPEPCRLSTLITSKGRRDILTSVMAEASKLMRKTDSILLPPALGEDQEFDRKLASPDLRYQPLHLLMAGINAIEHKARSLLTLRHVDLAARLANDELGRLASLARHRGLDPAFLTHLAGWITLTDGCRLDRLREVIDCEQKALRWERAGPISSIIEILYDTFPSGDGKGVSPLLPELVGEAAVIAAFRERTPREKEAIVQRCYDMAPNQVTDCVVRISQDFASTKDHEALVWLDALVARAGTSERLEIICDRLPELTVNLVEKAVEIERRNIKLLQEADVVSPRLASGLSRLAHRLGCAGRPEEASHFAQEAVRIYRELDASGAGPFRALLASSLNGCANRLRQAGHRDDALRMNEEALKILRLISADSAEPIQLCFARALVDHATHLGDVGQREEALEAVEEAVSVLGRLGATGTGNAQADLAFALANLAVHQFQLGVKDDALKAANEAVDLYRKLAATRPDEFRPNLARALNDLAILIGDSDHQEALFSCDEAVEIQRGLAEARPTIFGADLVRFLNTRAQCLCARGLFEPSYDSAVEAACLAAELPCLSPTERKEIRAASLNTLSIILCRLERNADAVKAAADAVAIERELVASLPLRFLPDLAPALTNFARRLRDVGNHDGAIEMAAEATMVWRHLALKWPDTFQSALDRSLQLWGELRGGHEVDV